MLAILSSTEDRFVEALIETGDPTTAAAMLGISAIDAARMAKDPRVQSAILDALESGRALDAARAMAVTRQLAQRADQDSVRLRAAQQLLERSLGKVPDQLTITHNVEGLSRASLYSEIKQLLGEVGLPDPIEGQFEEVSEAHDQHINEAQKKEPQPPALVDEGGRDEYIPPLPTHLQ